MAECIAEDDLLDLARGGRPLGETPALEAHLADCPACSSLLCTLLAMPRDDVARRDLAGATLGPYRLDSLIGAGAMGEVYRGWDLRLHRHVAVKALSARFAEDPDRVRRVEAEGRAAAAITHPNVVTVYDAGTDEGVPFIVSELIHGESLRSVLDRGPVPRQTALELGLGLARGLAAAHAKGVVHRDLKPGNLIVTDDGTLKILDFGLAKLSGDRDAEATEPGTLLGTAGYLSPEQARGEPADERSDLFSAGAILYELLGGRRAFGGATFAERLSEVLRDTPPPLDDPAGPIVLRCLEKDPKKRFQSANDLAWVLERQLRGDAPPPRPLAARPMISRRTFFLGAAATGIGGAVLGRMLARPRAAVIPEYRQMTFRQGRVASARFTSDGGSLVYSAAWEELPMAVYLARVGGGGTRALELPSAQLLAVSSRGQLALSLEHRFVAGFYQHGQLALVPLEGGEPRGLGVDVQHADFAPDGTTLAVVRRAGDRFRLELPVGKVIFEAGWLSHPRVSPDGQVVACLVHDSPMDDMGNLVLVPRDGGAARTISGNWSSIDGLAWAPGGDALWISASRSGGNNSIRAIALDGRQMTRIPAAGRMRMYDVAADGRTAVAHSAGRSRMMVKPPGTTGEIDLSLSDVSMVADLSADGRTVAFAEYGDVDTANGAYVRATAGGPGLRLGAALPLDLADDGRGVLAMRYGTETGLAEFPVPEGQARPLRDDVEQIDDARWGADGTIVVAGGAKRRPHRLWRLGPDGKSTPITDEGVVGTFRISPDGRRAAMIVEDRLLVVDVDGKAPPQVVPGRFVEESVCGWHASGAAVFVGGSSPPAVVRRVELATGSSTELYRIDPPRLGRRGFYGMVVSQDGDAYAYSYGQESSRLYTMTTDDRITRVGERLTRPGPSAGGPPPLARM